MITRSRVSEFWEAWTFAAVECAQALEAWVSADPEDKDIGYHAYLASLDREEKAAIVLAERVDPTAAARLRFAG